MNIVVANTKGGTGKTTTAVQLALYLTGIGKKVLLVDADIQGSAFKALAERGRLEIEPIQPCAFLPDLVQLRTQIKAYQADYDHIIIDSGGRAGSHLVASILSSEVLLVPITPSAVDASALGDLKAIITDAREVFGAEFKALSFISMADVSGSDNFLTEKRIRRSGFLEFLDASLGKRKAFRNATALGVGVYEMKNPDSKACNEIRRLAQEIFNKDEEKQNS